MWWLLYSGFKYVLSVGLLLQAVHGHFSNTVENICWSAPEVLAQDLSGYSFKSDSYSIGIAALELATGEAPFAGLPVTEVCLAGNKSLTFYCLAATAAL